jgi:hypothetical protein
MARSRSSVCVESTGKAICRVKFPFYLGIEVRQQGPKPKSSHSLDTWRLTCNRPNAVTPEKVSRVKLGDMRNMEMVRPTITIEWT